MNMGLLSCGQQAIHRMSDFWRPGTMNIYAPRQHTSPTGQERRRAQRHRVLQQAYIIFNNRRSTLTCRVRDISAYGARLKLADVAVVPKHFHLYFPIDSRERPCEVVWRGMGQIGVKFLDTV
jgi:hypothetical protein